MNKIYVVYSKIKVKRRTKSRPADRELYIVNRGWDKIEGCLRSGLFESWDLNKFREDWYQLLID